MQRGCMERLNRKRGPLVWQFRWSVIGPDGKRLYHKKIVGTVERYPDENAARRAVVGLVSEINTRARPMNAGAMTVAQLCDHFEQRELARENTWRSHATKIVYKAYLSRWIRPHWQKYDLAEVRTIQVESWLRGLPLAKSSCAKIRNVMSVLFNHACRYELFDHNPIYLVRQSAKRRRPPTVLVPSEIKALVDNLDVRERTLVLLAASTGLRQSEMFGLKWGDIDFAQRNMSVTRSIVYGHSLLTLNSEEAVLVLHWTCRDHVLPVGRRREAVPFRSHDFPPPIPFKICTYKKQGGGPPSPPSPPASQPPQSSALPPQIVPNPPSHTAPPSSTRNEIPAPRWHSALPQNSRCESRRRSRLASNARWNVTSMGRASSTSACVAATSTLPSARKIPSTTPFIPSVFANAICRFISSKHFSS